MNGSLAIWDAATGQLVWSRGRHEGYVHEVAFTPDSRKLFSGGADGVAYLWDLRPTEPADESDPEELWNALDGTDVPAAYRADVGTLRPTRRRRPAIGRKVAAPH